MEDDSTSLLLLQQFGYDWEAMPSEANDQMFSNLDIYQMKANKGIIWSPELQPKMRLFCAYHRISAHALPTGELLRKLMKTIDFDTPDPGAYLNACKKVLRWITRNITPRTLCVLLEEPTYPGKRLSTWKTKWKIDAHTLSDWSNVHDSAWEEDWTLHPYRSRRMCLTDAIKYKLMLIQPIKPNPLVAPVEYQHIAEQTSQTSQSHQGNNNQVAPPAQAEVQQAPVSLNAPFCYRPTEEEQRQAPHPIPPARAQHQADTQQTPVQGRAGTTSPQVQTSTQRQGQSQTQSYHRDLRASGQPSQLQPQPQPQPQARAHHRRHSLRVSEPGQAQYQPESRSCQSQHEAESHPWTPVYPHNYIHFQSCHPYAAVPILHQPHSQHYQAQPPASVHIEPSAIPLPQTPTGYHPDTRASHTRASMSQPHASAIRPSHLDGYAQPGSWVQLPRYLYDATIPPTVSPGRMKHVQSDPGPSTTDAGKVIMHNYRQADTIDQSKRTTHPALKGVERNRKHAQFFPTPEGTPAREVEQQHTVLYPSLQASISEDARPSAKQGIGDKENDQKTVPSTGKGAGNQQADEESPTLSPHKQEKLRQHSRYMRRS